MFQTLQSDSRQEIGSFLGMLRSDIIEIEAIHLEMTRVALMGAFFRIVRCFERVLRADCSAMGCNVNTICGVFVSVWGVLDRLAVKKIRNGAVFLCCNDAQPLRNAK